MLPEGFEKATRTGSHMRKRTFSARVSVDHASGWFENGCLSYIISREFGIMGNLTKRITVNPEQCGGRPCVRGMRIRVTDVLDLLANGLTPEQIREEMPDLELEDIKACIKFARDKLDHPVLVP